MEADVTHFFALGGQRQPDDNLLAYSVDVVARTIYLAVQGFTHRSNSKFDEIAGIGAGVTWAADNRTRSLHHVDAAWRLDTVWRYRLGSGHLSSG